MRTMLAALVAVCVLTTMPALAADDDGGGGGAAVKTEKGVYATLGGMVALDAYSLPTASGEAGWGLDTRVGYRVFPWLAGELQYQYVPHQQITERGVGRTDLATNALTANGKIYVFNGAIQPYLLLGFGFQNINASGAGHGSSLQSALRVGGGAQVMFTEHIGAYGEITYLQPFASLQDYATVPLALGAVYQF